jgi:hypothetical protein
MPIFDVVIKLKLVGIMTYQLEAKNEEWARQIGLRQAQDTPIKSWDEYEDKYEVQAERVKKV